MNWKTLLVVVLLALAYTAACIVGGMRYQFNKDRNAPGDTTLHIVERPITLPTTEHQSTAQHIPPNEQRATATDSLIARARRADSLEAALRKSLQKVEVTFKDTISVKDTCGSFYALQVRKIEYDPLSGMITEMVSYDSAKFTMMERTIERMIEKPFNVESWLFDWKTILLTAGLIIAAIL